MKKPLQLLALTLALFSLIPGASCASNASGLDDAVTGPAIVIEYEADFGGETPTGNLKLGLDLTIRNEGGVSFNTAPAGFSVKVDKYTYPVRESFLETVDLADGDSIRGRLFFEVPPEAATPRTGFTVIYSGKTAYDVRWVRALKGTEGGSGAAGPAPVVNITYATDRYWLDAPGNRFLKVAPPGALFLLRGIALA